MASGGLKLVGSARGRAAMAGVVAAGLLLIWAIIAAVETDPIPADLEQTSARPASSDAASLLAAAEAEVARGPENTDWKRVTIAARAALAEDPLTGRALGYYGLGLAGTGEADQALAAMRLAADRSLRDVIPHTWLYSYDLQSGDFGSALSHADVIIRSQPELRYIFYDSMRQLTALPGGLDALATALAADPPWRSEFLLRTLDQPTDLDGPTALFAHLQESRSPPLNREVAPLLTALVDAGRFQDALLIWLRILPPDQFASLDYLSNGDFRFPLSGLPFDWTFTPIPGAEISIAATIDGEDALTVQFFRGRVPFRNVTKLLVLPPGRYVFTGRERADDLQTERGMAWKIACAGPDGETLATTQPLKGRTGWQDFETTFTVPAGGCQAQWLRLELDARVALEEDVAGGAVWYDNLAVRRTGTEPRT